MNKAFYAKQNTKTPLFVGIFAIVLNFILCYLLSKTSLSYTGIDKHYGEKVGLWDISVKHEELTAMV